MAASADSVVHHTGMQPQDGSFKPIRLNEGKGTHIMKYRRIFKHYFTNDPTNINVIESSDTDFSGWTVANSMYGIPVGYMRSAFEPPTYFMLQRDFIGYRVLGVGFKVTYTNVQEQTARRFGTEVTVQSIDAVVPEIHTWVLSNEMTKKVVPEDTDAAKDFGAVNSEFTVLDPVTVEQGLLKKCKLQLDEDFVEAVHDKMGAADYEQPYPPNRPDYNSARSNPFYKNAMERRRKQYEHGPRGNLERLRSEIRSKSTRLNSSHITISYAVFCLKKKKTKEKTTNSTIITQSQNT